MPRYRVYELQQEILTRKWLYEVEAPDENSAMLLAENGGADGIDCGLLEEPYIGDSGFAAQPPDGDAKGWDEALSSLESVKGDGASAPMPSSVVEAIEAALNYFEDTRHGKEWIESGGVEADMLRRALNLLQN